MAASFDKRRVRMQVREGGREGGRKGDRYIIV